MSRAAPGAAAGRLAAQRASRARDALAAALVLAAAVLAAAPLLAADGWPDGHERLRYLVLADRFAAAVAAGEAYPRYLADLYGGYGYPVFCFYQPALFFLATPLVLAFGALTGMRVLIVLLLALGGAGAGLLVRELAGRGFGLFGALWFLLTPYLYANLYVRGDLTELMGMLVGPWLVFAVLRLARSVQAGGAARLPTLGLAAALAVLVTSHPAPALLLAPGACALALVLAFRAPRAGALLARVAIASVIALALSAPYWATLLELRPYVAFERLTQGYFRPERHLLVPQQLVSTRWGFGGSAADSSADAMSFQLGALHLAVALLGAWLGRRSRAVTAAALAYGALALLMLEPARAVWEHAGFLRLLQFPWRLLSVTATLQLVAAAGLCSWLGRRAWPRPVRAGALALLIAAGLGIHRDQFAVGRVSDPGPTLAVFGGDGVAPQFEMLGGVAEYLPRTARRPPPGSRDRSSPPFQLAGPGRLEAASGHPYDLRCRVTAERAVELRIERVYLPDWDVQVDGVAVRRATLEAMLDARGMMRIALGPGVHEVRARYAGPPRRRLRNALAAGVLGGCALLFFALRPAVAPADESGRSQGSRARS